MIGLDLCCRACRSAFAGVCHKHHECACHEERRRDRYTGRSTVPDPTGNKAVRNAMKTTERRPDPGRRS